MPDTLIKETAEEVFAEIVVVFRTRGLDHSDAIRWVDTIRASALRATIKDVELRGLAERYCDACSYWASRR